MMRDGGARLRKIGKTERKKKYEAYRERDTLVIRYADVFE